MKRELITISEYAKKNGVQRDTIYKRVKRNDLPKGVKLQTISGRMFLSIPVK